MDTLPLEILQNIFELACTDGGLTGCSLSLTSRAIREAARMARFHSVSLVAYPVRLSSFVELYARECDPALGDIPRVAHLHLIIPPSLGPRRYVCGGVIDTLPPHLDPQAKPPASPTTTHATVLAGERTPSPRSPHSHSAKHKFPTPRSPALAEGNPAPDSPATPHARTHQPTPPNHAQAQSEPPTPNSVGPTVVITQPTNDKEPQQIVYSPEYRDAARTLARLVAPHVETLVIQRGFRCQVRLLTPELAFLDRPFPRVRELTILGLADAGELVVPHARVAPLFPAATRLHLVRKGLAGHGSMGFWREHAPRATHLRVSCLRAPFGKFVPSLAESVGVAHMPDLSPPAKPAYPTLRAVVLHQDPPTVAEQEKIAVVEAYSMLWHSLEHLKAACATQNVEAVIADPFYIHFEEWGDRLRNEWLERIVGGSGCWKELEGQQGKECGGVPS
ncbi:hypothetical protein C8Q77DRAFT_1073530 [Trametes polyzona]|nr:hypothetical protein C8Q77DRAFT_1073530 [Trametes polyzona]